VHCHEAPGRPVWCLQVCLIQGDKSDTRIRELPFFPPRTLLNNVSAGAAVAGDPRSGVSARARSVPCAGTGTGAGGGGGGGAGGGPPHPVAHL